MLRLEARPEPSKALSLASPLIALVLTAVIAAILFALLGKDPVRGLAIFFVEPLNGLRAVSEVALKATPLILCALGLAVCYRSNVWNIGAEGQLLLGAVAGGGMALWLGTLGLDAGRGALSPLVLLAGVAGGMLWAGITALLRDRFNASEILVSLMLVYVAQQLVNYLVFGPWKDPQGFNFPQTPTFDPSTWLPPLWRGTRLHWGALAVPVLVLLAWMFLFRSWRGFQLQVGGLAPAARVMPAFRRAARCGWRCWAPAAWPVWPGPWRWPGRCVSSRRTSALASASPPSSCASSAGCTRWASCSAASCCR